MSEIAIPIFEHEVDIPTRVGIDGKNAFELWQQIEGNEEKSFQDWIDWLLSPAREIYEAEHIVTDSITGTIYNWSIEVTNGTPSITITEL